MRVADIVVQTLQAAGVRHCYGIVGDTLNYVTDAIHRSGIEWVHVRHEETGAFAAGAWARATAGRTRAAARAVRRSLMKASHSRCAAAWRLVERGVLFSRYRPSAYLSAVLLPRLDSMNRILGRAEAGSRKRRRPAHWRGAGRLAAG